MKSTFIFFFFFSVINLQAQSPYSLNVAKEVALTGTGIALYFSGQLLEDDLAPLTEMEILSLDRNSINSFDRGATYNQSLTAKQASDAFVYGSLMLPAFMLLGKEGRNDAIVIGVMYIETIALTAEITELTKRLAFRTRPYVYNENFDMEEKQHIDARYSFFSGHTSVSASMSFFTAKLFADYYPNSKWKPLVWGGAILYPAVTGYLRVAAGKHFPTDVMTGYAIGALIGYFIPVLHKNKTSEDSSWKLDVGISSFSLAYKL